jgi:hypothetical protein
VAYDDRGGVFNPFLCLELSFLVGVLTKVGTLNNLPWLNALKLPPARSPPKASSELKDPSLVKRGPQRLL